MLFLEFIICNPLQYAKRWRVVHLPIMFSARKPLMKTHRKALKPWNPAWRMLLVEGRISLKHNFLCAVRAVLGSQGIIDQMHRRHLFSYRGLAKSLKGLFTELSFVTTACSWQVLFWTKLVEKQLQKSWRNNSYWGVIFSWLAVPTVTIIIWWTIIHP